MSSSSESPSAPVPKAAPSRLRAPLPLPSRLPHLGDQVFKVVCLVAALVVPLLILLLVYFLVRHSWSAITGLGGKFFLSATWGPNEGQFGALPFIYGTLVTSAVAMALAVPLGVGAAAYLAEIATGPVRRVAAFLIELLAAIPSVVYGFWGLFFVVPLVQPLTGWLGVESTSGKGLFTSGLLLAIMIVPYIAAITYDVCRAVPQAQRQGALALGATRWQMIWGVVLPYARPGIIGGCFLALGRALGETMAVTMLIGNSPTISGSLFALGDSIPSVIANQLDSARVGAPLYLSALIELGLALFLVTVIIDILARWMISRLGRPRRGPTLLAQLLGAGRLPRPVDRPEQPTPSRNGLSLSMASPAAARRRNAIMTGVLAVCLVIILVPLFHIFAYVVLRGATALNVDFFTKRPIDRPSGLGPALVGSAVMVGLATLWAVPIGILGALFLSEYRTSRVTPVVRFVAELLGGVPSVVIGMFAFALLVVHADYSAYAGAFALGVMMLPIVLRASEESLRLVPSTLRNASYALGASHWQTVVKVIVPAALPAIITGVFLSIARIAGETAPLLFTAFSSNLWPESLNEPTPSLTYFIYNYSLHDQPEKWQLAWGAALVLLTVIMVLNVGIRLLTGKRVLSASRAD